MKDYISIGASPAEEPCAQVGSSDYYCKGRKECQAFRQQLIREFGEPPENAHLAIKSFPHDFGSYMEVVCYFDDHDEKSEEYAFKLEGNAPGRWDKQAQDDLKKASCEVGNGE